MRAVFAQDPTGLSPAISWTIPSIVSHQGSAATPLQTTATPKAKKEAAKAGKKDSRAAAGAGIGSEGEEQRRKMWCSHGQGKRIHNEIATVASRMNLTGMSADNFLASIQSRKALRKAGFTAEEAAERAKRLAAGIKELKLTPAKLKTMLESLQNSNASRQLGAECKVADGV